MVEVRSNQPSETNEDKMTYDQEKYRIKREKVLGVKRKSGLSFSTISIIISTIIILGLGISIIPNTVDYMVTRNLDDVIYKLNTQGKWPDEILDSVSEIKGVEKTKVDKDSTRLVITFDRSVVNTDRFSSLFRNQRIKTIQLNRVSHRQRVADLREEAKLETL